MLGMAIGFSTSLDELAQWDLEVTKGEKGRPGVLFSEDLSDRDKHALVQ